MLYLITPKRITSFNYPGTGTIPSMEKKAEALAEMKQAAGYQAADLVGNGMVVGLGTGSTVYFTIERLAARMEEGLEIRAVPTSFQTAARARKAGIPLTTLDDEPVLDVAIDGADEVDPAFRLIKGRGAALLREKCVAAAAGRFIVVVDNQKMVGKLAAPVPVEVLPFAITPVMAQLAGLGCMPVIREAVKKDGPVITDNGNFITDCTFADIRSPENLETAIAAIPGVMESGLFCQFTRKTTIIVGGEKRCRVLTSADVVP